MINFFLSQKSPCVFLLILLLVAIISCQENKETVEKIRTVSVSKAGKNNLTKLVNEYLLGDTAIAKKSNYPFEIIDSVVLRSISTTVYSLYLTSVICGGSTYVLRDHLSNRMNSISKGEYLALPMTHEIENLIMENDSLENLVIPFNPSFIGLEEYLNQCTSVRDQEEINPEVVDTIFRFFAGTDLVRFSNAQEIDTFFAKFAEKNYGNFRSKEEQILCNDKRKWLLKQKISRRNVFLYKRDANRLYFLELNPGYNQYGLKTTMGIRLDDSKVFFPGLKSRNRIAFIALDL